VLFFCSVVDIIRGYIIIVLMLFSTRRRARGNWWYGRGEAQLAVQLYRRALDVLDESEGGISDPTPSGEMPPTSDDLKALLDERLRVHNNMAAAQLKAGAYDAALQVSVSKS
jgi:FK506-binding protein 8